MTDDNQTEEYTKFSAKVQLGDGPDQRGDITVEMSREPNSDSGDRQRDVELPNGTTVPNVPGNDKQFAEFYFELTRGVGTLREALGLEDAE